MELSGYQPPAPTTGDKFSPKDNAGHILVVHVRDYRTGIKTQYNSNPEEKGYKPEGGSGLVVDVADLTTNTVAASALWMAQAIVDRLSGAVGQVIVLRFALAPGKSYYLPEVFQPGSAEFGQADAWLRQYGQWWTQECDNRRAAKEAEAAQAAQQASTPAPGGMPPAGFGNPGQPIGQVPGMNPAQAQPGFAQPMGPGAAAPNPYAQPQAQPGVNPYAQPHAQQQTAPNPYAQPGLDPYAAQMAAQQQAATLAAAQQAGYAPPNVQVQGQQGIWDVPGQHGIPAQPPAGVPGAPMPGAPAGYAAPQPQAPAQGLPPAAPGAPEMNPETAALIAQIQAGQNPGAPAQ